MTGWTTAGGLAGFRSLAYTAAGLTWPSPVDRGSNYFAGGFNGTLATATQTLALGGFGGLSALVDAGAVTYDLRAYLGGVTFQDDNMTYAAEFLDGGASTVGTVTLGPVLGADRGGVTALLLRSATGTLAVGTRSIRFTMTSVRSSGQGNDGYADNLSFVLSTGPQVVVPEPGTWALLGTGLAALAGVARRRGRAAA